MLLHGLPQGTGRGRPADEKWEDHVGEEDQVTKSHDREFCGNLDAVVYPNERGHGLRVVDKTCGRANGEGEGPADGILEEGDRKGERVALGIPRPQIPGEATTP
jgi:hypothetical protein